VKLTLVRTLLKHMQSNGPVNPNDFIAGVDMPTPPILDPGLEQEPSDFTPNGYCTRLDEDKSKPPYAVVPNVIRRAGKTRPNMNAKLFKKLQLATAASM